jgi:hypothetical protein
LVFDCEPRIALHSAASKKCASSETETAHGRDRALLDGFRAPDEP